MAYRDFDSARLEERRTLLEEIERLDAERARLESTLRRRDELTQRLRELDLSAGLHRAEHSGLLGSRRKRLLWVAVAVMAAAGIAAGASVQPQDTQQTRSLLLLVKYVDRVGTEVQKRIEPSYYRRSSENTYPEESAAW